MWSRKLESSFDRKQSKQKGFRAVTSERNGELSFKTLQLKICRHVDIDALICLSICNSYFYTTWKIGVFTTPQPEVLNYYLFVLYK